VPNWCGLSTYDLPGLVSRNGDCGMRRMIAGPKKHHARSARERQAQMAFKCAPAFPGCILNLLERLKGPEMEIPQTKPYSTIPNESTQRNLRLVPAENQTQPGGPAQKRSS
jgi:hypothetical protein